MTNQPHQPVLAGPVLEFLAPQPGETYLDLTAGYGGHAAAVKDRVKSGQMVLVDRDQEAIKHLEARFKAARIINNDFASAAANLAAAGFQANMILMDLGVSSPQLDSAQRGFSFKQSAPLDMRMDSRQQLTAATIVNSYQEQQLADLLWTYGDERKSRQIAKAIVSRRPITDTVQLAEVIAKQFYRYQRIHPATRSFQALRIAVNDELGQLEKTLELLPELLAPDGRLVIISFHSLEDRLVKRWLKAEPRLKILAKHVVKAGQADVNNPRARSAKLRAALKLNKNKQEANDGNQNQSPGQQRPRRQRTSQSAGTN